MDDEPNGPDRLDDTPDETPGEGLAEEGDSQTGQPDLTDPAAGGPRYDLPLDLDRGDAALPEEEPAERSGTITVIVISSLILIGSAVVLWWWYASRGAAPGNEGATQAPAAAVEAGAPEPAPESEAAAEPAVPAPEPPPDLLGSDSLVRQLVAGLSRHAEWAAWLAPDELALSFVRATAAVAYDEPPQTGLLPLRPEDGFSVVRRGQQFFPAETSYRRYDLAVEVFDSIDVAGAARAYGRLLPLFERAHDELGLPGEFADTLELAVTKLLSTPMPESPPELRLRVISFEYVDPQLESLSPAQKLLLRLGPENGERVRSRIREFYGALE